jgi:DNA-binding MarR family transcriptional regulator
MFNLFSSKSKESVFSFVSSNPEVSVKDIVTGTKLEYKYVYKIVTEFLEQGIVEKTRTKYSLSSKFVEYFRKKSDLISEKYVDSIYLRNKLDMYNAFCSLEEDEKIKAKVDGILSDWFFKKLDDWYSKFYDPNDIETKKIKLNL